MARKTPNRDEERPRDFVGPVAHVMNVLRAFDAGHPHMTLAEVAKRVDLDRAGARRYLLTLAHLGYVVHDGKLFRLSSKVLELGYAFMSSMPLSNVAQGTLEQITARTGETCALAILDGDHIVHVAKAASANRMLAPTVTVGRPFRALYTSTGRMLIALKDEGALADYVHHVEVEHLTAWSITDRERLLNELRKIRRQGYAIADQEIEEGIRSIAVPVLDTEGKPVAAVAVITSVATVPKKRLTEEFLPILRTATLELRGSVRNI